MPHKYLRPLLNELMARRIWRKYTKSRQFAEWCRCATANSDLSEWLQLVVRAIAGHETASRSASVFQRDGYDMVLFKLKSLNFCYLSPSVFSADEDD